MTPGQIAYRKFLKSDFWKTISAEKKHQVGRCEECGSTEHLQAHHIEYPEDWYDTTLDHLQVLCRKHHKMAHGLPWEKPPRVDFYREDLQFNRIAHWTSFMRTRMCSSPRALKASEHFYLEWALVCYPPTEKDSAVDAMVQMVLADEAFAIEEAERLKDPSYPYRKWTI